MKRLVLNLILAAVALLLLANPALAQDRATMSAPIIRSSGEEVVFTVRFENFAEGRTYRLGFGGAGEKAPSVSVELAKEEEAMGVKSINFVQENTSGWWKIEQVAAIGYSIGTAEIPAEGQALTFRVTVPRDVADGHEKVYVFVARDYGSGRWYLEDGSEIDQTDW